MQTKKAEKETENEAKEIALVQAIAKKAGLESSRTSRTAHFLGIGDADARFRTDALKRCEVAGTGLHPALQRQGFQAGDAKRAVDRDHAQRAPSLIKRLSAKIPGTKVGGHYDLDTNRLVMFDFRPTDEGLACGERSDTRQPADARP